MEEIVCTGASLERVKDMFLFSCYSGLTFTELKKLTTDNLVKGMDGKDWIYTKREKTQQTVKVPLLNPAKEIIKKFQDQHLEDTKEVFPVISNQKTNKYLKEIMKSIGIRKKITFHSARHTFATVVTLSNVVLIETVSNLLGHTKLSTTQIYARVLENKLSSDFSKLGQVIGEKREINGN